MAQHDNGRRNVGQPSGAWQQGQRDPQDHSNGQQDQSSRGRHGSAVGGGQQGGHDDPRNGLGHQNQFDANRAQQGDHWRERQSANPGGRDAGSGGQGSFGGQASDNDDGNRGITESGNFRNYGSQRDSSHDGALTNQDHPGQGGNHDQGGQSGQHFGGYRHGYDARTDPTGGYGSSNDGSGNSFGSGNHGGGDRNAGSYGSRGGNDLGRGQGQPNDQDRYGDNGYKGNFQQGQRGQAYHDPDYHQWRSEQVARLDRDYDEWRQHRYQRFSQDFEHWRSNRDNNPASRGSSQVGANATPTTVNGEQGTASDVSGQQGSASRQDVSNGGDKGAGKTATT